MLFDTPRKKLEREMRASGRLPSGQSLTEKWPLLHEGPVPKFDPATICTAIRSASSAIAGSDARRKTISR